MAAEPEQKPDTPERKVDLDLDVLAPPPRTMQFKGVIYNIPADISVPTLLQAVRLREQVAAGESGDIEDQEVAVQAMFDLVMNLIRAENGPDIPELNVTVTQLMYIVGLILSGQENVTMDQALISALGGDEDVKPTEDEAEHPPTVRKPRKKAA